MPRMNIGVLARGLSVPVGGVATFLEHVLPLLPRLDPGNRYIFFHNSPRHRGGFPGAEDVFFAAPGTLLWENVWFPIHLRRHRPDVLLCAKNLVPWFVPRGMPTALVAYDLLYYPIRGRYLDEYKARDVLYFRLAFPRSVRRAQRIIAISNCARKDLMDVFGVDGSRVRIVHLGVEQPPAAAFAQDRLAAVRKRYALDRPYAFYPGTLSPRKNMVRVLEAFASVAGRIPHDLVVTAGKSWKDQEVFDAVARLGLSSRFRRLGAVPREDLPALYRMADAMVFASLYEGFGLPILEAMACGCPVLASNASSMPEVAGEAALLVEPTDTGQIADGLVRILTDRDLASRLRERGAERAREFSWEKTARGVVEVLAEVGRA